MRRIGIALIGLGLAIFLIGGSLRVAAWRGQIEAKDHWESEAGESATAEGHETPWPSRSIQKSPQKSPSRPSVVARFSEQTAAPTRLSFPGQGQDFFVREGATAASLLLGPAHVAWSGAPGENGNCIITGHRDTHFRLLRNVNQGQEITLETQGRMFRYRVVSMAVVESKDDSFYQPTREPVLTLVTCYPFSYFGRAPKRFIVRAELL